MTNQLRLFDQPQTEFTSDDWYTPKSLFDALGVTFDLDVACPPGGPPNTPCRRYYTQADDGLASPWDGLVWMNPPYSKPAPWVTKFLDHGNGICLTGWSKSKWCERLWTEADAVIYIQKLLFDRPDGSRAGIFMPLVLAGIGDQAAEALQRSNLGKVR